MPWFAWIAIAGVIGFAANEIVRAIVTAKTRRAELGNSEQLRKVVESNTAVSSELLDRLNAVDRRLASVEKTLTDIP